MATHSSTLAWKIPRVEEPGRLQSMGSQRVGTDWATSLQFPHPLRAGPVLLTLCFPPLSLHSTKFCVVLYVLFCWSGTPVHSQMVFCMHFCVWRCIPDVSVERDVLYHPPIPLPSCSPLNVEFKPAFQLAPLHFMPLGWCHLHMWGCWYLDSSLQYIQHGISHSVLCV